MSLKEFKKPFNLIMFFIAIIAIGLSIFFFYAGQKKRKPVYQITEPYSMVFDSSVSSPNISVIDSNGKLIEEDIYLITILFWNAGNLPIEPDEIRSPIILHIHPISRLLDFSIVTQTDPSIVGFTLSETHQSPSSDEGQLLLSWNHLDPGTGAIFQIIYTGPKNSIASFSGKILGVREISKIPPSPSTGFPYGLLIAIILFLVMTFWFIFTLNDIRHRRRINKIERVFMIIFYVWIPISIISDAYLIIVFINQLSTKPPF